VHACNACLISAMFLQVVNVVAGYQLVSHGVGPLEGRDLSVLMMASKHLYRMTAPLANLLAVNELSNALLECVRQIEPGSEMLISKSSFSCVDRSDFLTQRLYVVSKNPTDRTVRVFCTKSQHPFLTSVRPSVFVDAGLMAERLLTVNSLHSALLQESCKHRMGSEVVKGSHSSFCIKRTPVFTSLHYTFARSVERGTVVYRCYRPMHPSVSVLHPAISIDPVNLFAGRLFYTDNLTGKTVNTLYALPNAFHVDGLPRSIVNGHESAVVG